MKSPYRQLLFEAHYATNLHWLSLLSITISAHIALGQPKTQIHAGINFQTSRNVFVSESGLHDFNYAEDRKQLYPINIDWLIGQAQRETLKVNFTGRPTYGFGLSTQIVAEKNFAIFTAGFQQMEYTTEQSFFYFAERMDLVTRARDNRYNLGLSIGKLYWEKLGFGVNLGYSWRRSRYNTSFLYTDQNGVASSYPAKDPSREKGSSFTVGGTIPFINKYLTAELRYDLFFVMQIHPGLSTSNIFRYRTQAHQWSIRLTVPLRTWEY